MSFADESSAAFYLSQINYYCLTAYWLPFEADHSTHQFIEGTTFDAVLDLYDFDRSLRLLALDAIERFEVAVRTRWAYELAHAHGPHAYLQEYLFRDKENWRKNLADLRSAVARSEEVFIRHYLANYSAPELPPIWSVCEVMSLGHLSRWYKNVGPKQTRRALALHFGFDQGALDGVLENLTVYAMFAPTTHDSGIVQFQRLYPFLSTDPKLWLRS
jgi:abortive infection bacteriophage resistance protein